MEQDQVVATPVEVANSNLNTANTFLLLTLALGAGIAGAECADKENIISTMLCSIECLYIPFLTLVVGLNINARRRLKNALSV